MEGGQGLVGDGAARGDHGFGKAAHGVQARLAGVAAILQRHALEYEKAGFDRLRMMQAVHNTRQQNFSSITSTITEGVSGVGCALKVSTSHWASISFGAITPRLPQARQQELGELLATELLQF